MVNNVVSPFTTSASAPTQAPPPAVTAEPASTTPQDAATIAPEDSASLSTGQKAGLALMTGVTLLGGGLMAPATAQARDLRPPMSHSQVMNVGYHGHHHGGNAAGAIVGGIIGGIIGGAIANGGGYYPPVYPAPMPPPPPMPPPMPMPPQGGYGYNAVGPDGLMHHFDNYGHVHDRSGHYILQPGAYGGYEVYPAPPHY